MTYSPKNSRLPITSTAWPRTNPGPGQHADLRDHRADESVMGAVLDPDQEAPDQQRGQRHHQREDQEQPAAAYPVSRSALPRPPSRPVAASPARRQRATMPRSRSSRTPGAPGSKSYGAPYVSPHSTSPAASRSVSRIASASGSGQPDQGWLEIRKRRAQSSPARPAAGARLVREHAGELAVAHAADERIPLRLRERQHWPRRFLAVPDADPAVWQSRHLHAVAVGETQRTLHPAHGVRARRGLVSCMTSPPMSAASRPRVRRPARTAAAHSYSGPRSCSDLDADLAAQVRQLCSRTSGAMPGRRRPSVWPSCRGRNPVVFLVPPCGTG